jgi:hypothetical protein
MDTNNEELHTKNEDMEESSYQRTGEIEKGHPYI